MMYKLQKKLPYSVNMLMIYAKYTYILDSLHNLSDWEMKQCGRAQWNVCLVIFILLLSERYDLSPFEYFEHRH
jgi:hypothetical protein